MRITPDILREKGASARTVAIFSVECPDGVDITEAWCAATPHILPWDWVAMRFLDRAALDEYWLVEELSWKRRRAACEAAASDGKDAYTRVWNAAWREYRRACAAAFGRLAERQGAKRPEMQP